MNVAVIGLGKLGSPLAAVFASKGHEVFGHDVNPKFVAKLNSGIAPVEEMGLQGLIDSTGPIKATVDLGQAVQFAEIVFIIVPTPSMEDGSFSNRYVWEVLSAIGKSFTPNFHQVIVIVSTLSPGSAETLLASYESLSSRKNGNEFSFVYSPEFIALGSVITDLLTPSFVLIGEGNTKGGDILTTFYRTIHNAPTKRMSFVSAEITKLSLNVALTQRISYANTVSELCENYTGADAADVLETIGLDRRIGSCYLSSGTAFGGPCFPRDSRAFERAAEEVCCQALMVQAGSRVNELQTIRIERIIDKIRGKKWIGILGTAYKENTHVTEESASLSLQKRLEQKGYEVACSNAIQDTAIQVATIIVVMVACPKFQQLLLPSDSEATVIDTWGIVDRGLLPSKVHYIRLGVKDEERTDC